MSFINRVLVSFVWKNSVFADRCRKSKKRSQDLTTCQKLSNLRLNESPSSLHFAFFSNRALASFASGKSGDIPFACL